MDRGCGGDRTCVLAPVGLREPAFGLLSDRTDGPVSRLLARVRAGAAPVPARASGLSPGNPPPRSAAGPPEGALVPAGGRRVRPGRLRQDHAAGRGARRERASAGRHRLLAGVRVRRRHRSRRFAAGLCEAVDADPAPLESVEQAASAVTEAMWRRSPQQVALVLDDVQHVPPGRRLPICSASIIASLPANAHLVLAGRGEPPVPLARIEVAGGVCASTRTTSRSLATSWTSSPTCVACPRRGRHEQRVAALAELAASARSDATVDYVSQEVLAGAGPAERRDLALLAHLGPFDEDLAHAALGRDVDVRALTARLPLVTEVSSGERTLHALWRSLLADEVAPDEVAGTRARGGRAARPRPRPRGDPPADRCGAWDAVAEVAVAALGAAHPPVPRDVLEDWLHGPPDDPGPSRRPPARGDGLGRGRPAGAWERFDDIARPLPHRGPRGRRARVHRPARTAGVVVRGLRPARGARREGVRARGAGLPGRRPARLPRPRPRHRPAQRQPRGPRRAGPNAARIAQRRVARGRHLAPLDVADAPRARRRRRSMRPRRPCFAPGLCTSRSRRARAFRPSGSSDTSKRSPTSCRFSSTAWIRPDTATTPRSPPHSAARCSPSRAGGARRRTSLPRPRTRPRIRPRRWSRPIWRSPRAALSVAAATRRARRRSSRSTSSQAAGTRPLGRAAAAHPQPLLRACPRVPGPFGMRRNWGPPSRWAAIWLGRSLRSAPAESSRRRGPAPGARDRAGPPPRSAGSRSWPLRRRGRVAAMDRRCSMRSPRAPVRAFVELANRRRPPAQGRPHRARRARVPSGWRFELRLLGPVELATRRGAPRDTGMAPAPCPQAARLPRAQRSRQSGPDRRGPLAGAGLGGAVAEPAGHPHATCCGCSNRSGRRATPRSSFGTQDRP